MKRTTTPDRLARDAMAARYLLLHPRKMEPCAVCGRMIDPFHGRKYCGRECRNESNRLKALAKRQQRADQKGKNHG